MESQVAPYFARAPYWDVLIEFAVTDGSKRVQVGPGGSVLAAPASFDLRMAAVSV